MNTNLNFAMTFPPTKDYIINLLRIADGEKRSLDELYEYTGIPGGESSGKLRPHLDYSVAMGLLIYEYNNGEFKLNRTMLGEKIYSEDFSMAEDLSLQLLNYNMSSYTTGTLVWNLIVRQIVINKVTSIPILLNVLETKYDKKESSANRIITPFRSAQDGMFQPIEFVVNEEGNFKITELTISKQLVYMYGYSLLFDWEVLFPNSFEITFEQIRDVIKWGSGFGWSENSMFEALQLCEDFGIIKLNKQLSPMTIVRNMRTLDAVDKLYNLL